MKKILFLGACVASLAIASSAAFAADYTYTATGDIALTYPAANTTGNVTQISVDNESLTGLSGQITVLVLKGSKADAIVTDQENGTSYFDTSKIMYIDQETKGDSNFQSMGLRLGESVTTLPEGTYTVCIGGEGVTTLKTTTLTVAKKSGTPKTFKWGDVNGKDGVTSADSSYILGYAIGTGSAKIDGAPMDINAEFKMSDGKIYKWGDVNGKDGVTSADSSYILGYAIGTGSAKIDGAPMDINAEATYIVEN